MEALSASADVKTRMSDLSGKRILISGASSGLGSAIARGVAAAGAEVMVAARRTDRLRALVEEITAGGVKAHFVETDVSDVASIRNMVDAAIHAIGTIDVFFNNAGTQCRKPLLDVTPEDFDRLFAVNVRGMFFAAQEVARMMKATGGGAIINTGSIAGERSIANTGIYCASKSAIHSLTRALAAELARVNVRVNAIAPGLFETEMTEDILTDAEARKARMAGVPLGRVAAAEEIQGLAVFLASDAANYVTGSIYFIDGGLLV